MRGCFEKELAIASSCSWNLFRGGREKQCEAKFLFDGRHRDHRAVQALITCKKKKQEAPSSLYDAHAYMRVPVPQGSR